MSQFELITQGPANSSGQSPQATPNGLMLDAQNNVVSSVGTAGVEAVLQTRLATFQEQTALATITTAQALLTQALKSYFLNRLNRTLRIRGNGIYTSPGTTTPVMTIALVLGTTLSGGTTLATIATAALSSTATTNGQFQFEFTMSTEAVGAAAAAIEAHGRLSANIGANSLGAALATYADQNTAVVGSLNLEKALNLYVSVAANLTLTSAQLLFATIDVEGA